MVGLVGLASIGRLDAASVAGVTLPDTATVGSTRLVLNGLGLRTKFVLKVYVAGLYLPQKSSDAATPSLNQTNPSASSCISCME